MLILRIAWRSFLRHKRRSIITAAGIAFGLALLLISVGIATDSHRMMANMGIRMGAGHVLAQGRGYQEEQTIDYVVRDPASVMAAAESIQGVELVVPRVRASGLLAAGGSSAAVAVSGVDPRKEPRASLIASPERKKRGEYLRPLDAHDFVNQPPDIYVGVALASTLEIDVDDRVVLTVSPRGASRPMSAAFVVRGVFRTGIDDLDGFYVEIPMESAQALLSLGTDVTQVAVLVSGLEATGRVRAELETRLAGRQDLEILSWQQALAELHESIVLDDAGNYIMMAIIFVIVAIGIFNTVLMSVVERTREFGVMMAIGTSRATLFWVILAEALILAIAASIVGLAIGLGVHMVLATHGLDITNLYGDLEMAGIVFEGRMYSELSAPVVLRWTLVVMSIVIVSALYPAVRAARLVPLEAMRHA